MQRRCCLFPEELAPYHQNLTEGSTLTVKKYWIVGQSCATSFEIHEQSFKVKPVYEVCGFCLTAFSVTGSLIEEIFGLNHSWKLAKLVNAGGKRLKEINVCK